MYKYDKTKEKNRKIIATNVKGLVQKGEMIEMTHIRGWFLRSEKFYFLTEVSGYIAFAL